MTKVETLTQLLTRVNAGEDVDRVREEAKDFLQTVGPAEMSLAEQNLLESGFPPEDLSQLYDVHMELIRDEVARIRANLEPGHVIHTLLEEHDLILLFLAELENVNRTIQKMSAYDPARDAYQLVRDIAQRLIDVESHHQREEEVLFPALEQHGVTAPQKIMAAEHVNLKERKRNLYALVETIEYLDYQEFKAQLDTVTQFIVPNLREHIFKENNFLYPTALQVIKDPAVWKRLKSECDRIGYWFYIPPSP